MLAGTEQTLDQTRFLYTEYRNRPLYHDQPDLLDILDLLPNFVVQRRFPGDVFLENSQLDELMRFAA